MLDQMAQCFQVSQTSPKQAETLGADHVIGMWFQFAPNVKIPGSDKTRSRLFYGFPAVEWGPQNLARISVDAATNIIEDSSQRRTNVIDPQDIADTREFVRDHVVGVDSTVPAFSPTCLQTNVYGKPL